MLQLIKLKISRKFMHNTIQYNTIQYNKYIFYILIIFSISLFRFSSVMFILQTYGDIFIYRLKYHFLILNKLSRFILWDYK